MTSSVSGSVPASSVLSSVLSPSVSASVGLSVSTVSSSVSGTSPFSGFGIGGGGAVSACGLTISSRPISITRGLVSIFPASGYTMCAPVI